MTQRDGVCVCVKRGKGLFFKLKKKYTRAYTLNEKAAATGRVKLQTHKRKKTGEDESNKNVDYIIIIIGMFKEKFAYKKECKIFLHQIFCFSPRKKKNI